VQVAAESGRTVSRDEAVAFLNHTRCVYDLWKHMTHAGQE
jgi:hypothetical protein